MTHLSANHRKRPRTKAGRKAADVIADLLATMKAIIAEAPDEEPDEEDYDDTESAFNQGLDVQAWDTAQRLRAAVAKAEGRANG